MFVFVTGTVLFKLLSKATGAWDNMNRLLSLLVEALIISKQRFPPKQCCLHDWLVPIMVVSFYMDFARTIDFVACNEGIAAASSFDCLACRICIYVI